jgi:DNA repair exonuclease SbcCD ATPase subunit
MEERLEDLEALLASTRESLDAERAQRLRDDAATAARRAELEARVTARDADLATASRELVELRDEVLALEGEIAALRSELAASFAGHRPPFCLHCGYDLRVTSADRCPECGRPVVIPPAVGPPS